MVISGHVNFTPGQVVQRVRYEAVYRQIYPCIGVRLGRPRGRCPTLAEHMARLRAAEPHAIAERLIELESQAAQAARPPAAYTHVTVSFSISVLHASIWETSAAPAWPGFSRYGPQPGLPIRRRPGLSRRLFSACAAARPGPPAGQ